MNDHLYRLLLGVLCVWRITHLLQAEDGPWDVIVRLRRAAGEGVAGQLLDCFYCLSLWVALPLAGIIGRTVPERALLWLAFSAGAILLERPPIYPKYEVNPKYEVQYQEDKEN